MCSGPRYMCCVFPPHPPAAPYQLCSLEQVTHLLYLGFPIWKKGVIICSPWGCCQMTDASEEQGLCGSIGVGCPEGRRGEDRDGRALSCARTQCSLS